MTTPADALPANRINAPATVLVVDDEPGMLRYMRTMLELDRHQVSTAPSGETAIQQIKAGNNPDLVFLDLVMPGIDGLQTLEELRQLRPDLKVVMLSCVRDTAKVVRAIQLGALNYLTKPFDKLELDTILQQSCKPVLTRENDFRSAEIEDLGEDLFFVAASNSMRQIRTHVKTLAKVDVPVLLLGESGTGKEIVARLLHRCSPRAHRTFLKVNCAALPGELLESELFGYEPGAFTGANRSKPGKFELCNNGTILLDEIGEIPIGLQSKLLHVLQDQQFSRLGSRSNIQVDVRILAATNIDMPEAIAGKRFREDLFYRLNAFTIKIPPLRDRKEEIPFLLNHFMSRFSEDFARSPLPVTPRLVAAACEYPWPGNIRELSNFIKRYLILGDEGWAIEEMRSGTHAFSAPETTTVLREKVPIGLKSIVRSVKDEAEIEAICRTLEQTKWNRKEAAFLLNISYKALLYKIRQYKIDAPQTGARRFGTSLHA